MAYFIRLAAPCACLLLLTGAFATSPQAQTQLPATAAPAEAAAAPVEKGIPVTDKTVQTACGACHKADETGAMSRISFRRNTPEGWEHVIRRMISLNGLKIEPATAREVVRYLANNHGLAPEEARPGAFESERRLVDFKYTASRETEQVCTACHSMGRVVLQRRTKEDWGLLINMHRGWYPLVDFQAFRRTAAAQREPGPDGRPPDNRHPVDKALAHLTAAYPLHTAEWAAWSATMRAPKLAGQWAVSGHEISKGPIAGRLTVTEGTRPDEFTTDLTFTYVRTGETVSRKGRSVVYTGYQWRGRTTTAGGNDDSSMREVMYVDRDWQAMDGRWFTGGYDEIGIDVKLRRIGTQPTVIGTSRSALRAGTTGQELRLFGVNLPASIAAADIDLGPGLTVTKVTPGADGAVLTVDVAKAAAPGPRDIVVAGVVKPAALMVYERVDYIKVTPEWSMARLGGVTFPKQYARFEAVGFSNGRDGRPNTNDDLNLGVVDATWSMEEYAAVLNDDDTKYVGTLDAKTGVFTPNVEGPNPQRTGERNNIGDVWVVATYTPEGSKTRLRARGHLLVTVPLYFFWTGGRETSQ